MFCATYMYANLFSYNYTEQHINPKQHFLALTSTLETNKFQSLNVFISNTHIKLSIRYRGEQDLLLHCQPCTDKFLHDDDPLSPVQVSSSHSIGWARSCPVDLTRNINFIKT